MMCVESPHFVAKQPNLFGVHSAPPSAPSTAHTMTFFFRSYPQGQHYTQCPLLPVFNHLKMAPEVLIPRPLQRHLPPQVSIRERVSRPPFLGHFRDCIFWGSRGSVMLKRELKAFVGPKEPAVCRVHSSHLLWTDLVLLTVISSSWREFIAASVQMQAQNQNSTITSHFQVVSQS